jgi:hypothetical protein
MVPKQESKLRSLSTVNNEDAMIDDLILQGALEVAGIDSQTGEFLYSVTDKMKDIMPDLYEEHLNTVNKDIMALWENGFVDVDFNEDNPIVRLSFKAHDVKAISMLPKDLQWALEEIKRHLMG